jgi:hypothetical protein
VQKKSEEGARVPQKKSMEVLVSGKRAEGDVDPSKFPKGSPGTQSAEVTGRAGTYLYWIQCPHDGAWNMVSSYSSGYTCWWCGYSWYIL